MSDDKTLRSLTSPSFIVGVNVFIAGRHVVATFVGAVFVSDIIDSAAFVGAVFVDDVVDSAAFVEADCGVFVDSVAVGRIHVAAYIVKCAAAVPGIVVLVGTSDGRIHIVDAFVVIGGMTLDVLVLILVVVALGAGYVAAASCQYCRTGCWSGRRASSCCWRFCRHW